MASAAQTYSSRIERWQRYTRHNPCPICNGGDDDKRRRGERCSGYVSGDETHAYCTREEYAGSLPPNTRTAVPTFAHRLNGLCRCGEPHGAYVSRKDTTASAKEPTRSHHANPPSRIYTYRDANGEPHMRVLRYDLGPKDKTFRQQRPDGAGDWFDGLEGVAPILYRLDDLASADPWQPHFYVEGEKCAEALVDLGQVATCNPMGAGKVRLVSDSLEALRGRHVVILPDNDEPGRAHAKQVAEELIAIAASVRIVELPGLPEAGDVVDWLADGHTITELRALTAQTKSITALLVSAQQSNRAMQDDTPVEVVKMCSNCAREKELRQIAETSLANLRRERAIESRYMRMPNAQLSAPVRLAAIALRRELKEPTQDRPHDEQGGERLYRAAIAERLGCSEGAAGTHIRRLADAGIIQKRTVSRGFNLSETFISEGPNIDVPEQVPEPTRVSTWGGKRISCPTCGSDNVETRHVCRECGEVFHRHDANKPTEIVDADPDPTPEHLPAGDIKGDQVAPHAENSGLTVEQPASNRATVLALAEAKDWPHIEIAPATRVGGDQAAWERFTANNPAERIELALAALVRGDGLRVVTDYPKEASA